MPVENGWRERNGVREGGSLLVAHLVVKLLLSVLGMKQLLLLLVNLVKPGDIGVSSETITTLSFSPSFPSLAWRVSNWQRLYESSLLAVD